MSMMEANDVEMGETKHGEYGEARKLTTVVAQKVEASGELVEAVRPVAPKHAPAVLSWANVTVTAGGSDKQLIRDVSGSITGGFWAIMGGSGSGKTTLMNALAYRLDSYVRFSGDRRLNGKPYTHKILKSMSGYVMQDDVIHTHLTVAETLHYAAQLRLDKSVNTPEERERRVESVMEVVGITHCRDVIVGNSIHKGISGGERKRLCVATELLTNPSLLFLDEPTSGLDSVTALGLCETLKELSQTHCTVVCTIHQPQTKIFNMFDNLILLKSGQIVYQGSSSGALAVYEAAGLPCPKLMNPAEHLLDMITPSIGKHHGEHDGAYKQLAQVTPELHVDLTLGVEKKEFDTRNQIPWHWQLAILFNRDIHERMRKWHLFALNVAVAVILAAFTGGVFENIGADQLSVTKRLPAIFFIAINQGVTAAFQGTHTFPLEREICLRERAAGSYYVSAYALAKMLGDTITILPVSFAYSATVYWLIGLRPGVQYFFMLAFIAYLGALAATSVAVMISSVCRTVTLSVTIIPLAFEIARLFGGFLLAPSLVPQKFLWINPLSFILYSYVGMSLNELTDLHLYCQKSELKAGKCPYTSGNQVITAKGYDEYTIGECIGALVAIYVGARVAGYFALKYIKW